MQRPALISLAAYLLIGGCGFLGAPAFALRLLLANGTYGAIMPRVVGLFMCVLGGVFVQVVRARDYRYSLYTIVARSFIVVVMTALYCKAHDSLFLVWDALVLIGLVPSISGAAQSARVRGEHEKVMRLDLPPGIQNTLRRRTDAAHRGSEDLGTGSRQAGSECCAARPGR
jgi:hypothetical protein